MTPEQRMYILEKQIESAYEILGYNPPKIKLPDHMLVCPACNGTGEIYLGGEGPMRRIGAGSRPCGKCNGTGKFDPQEEE